MYGSKMNRRQFLISAVLMSLALNVRAQENYTPAQSPARERWNKMSDEEKNTLREKWKKYQELPPEKKEKIKNALNKYKKMDPEKRKEIKN